MVFQKVYLTLLSKFLLNRKIYLKFLLNRKIYFIYFFSYFELFVELII